MRGSGNGLRAFARTASKVGSPFHGSAEKTLWNPRATSGHPGLPVQRSASSMIATVAPTQQIATRASRPERPAGAYPFAPAIESLPCEQGQRKRGGHAPARRRPEEGEARQHDQVAEPRNIRAKTEQERTDGQKRQKPHAQRRGAIRGPPSCTRGAREPGRRRPDVPRAWHETGPRRAVARAVNDGTTPVRRNSRDETAATQSRIDIRIPVAHWPVEPAAPSARAEWQPAETPMRARAGPSPPLAG